MGGHVIRMGEIRKAYKIFVGRAQVKILLVDLNVNGILLNCSLKMVM
jgi:hypothetical protein